MKYSASLLKEDAPTDGNIVIAAATGLMEAVSATGAEGALCAKHKDEPSSKPTNAVWDKRSFIVLHGSI